MRRASRDLAGTRASSPDFEGFSRIAYMDDSIAPNPVELYSQDLDTTPQKRVLVCWEQSVPASPENLDFRFTARSPQSYCMMGNGW